MVDPVIENFLNDKKKTLDEFLEKARKEAVKITIGTHAAKFSHPNAESYVPRVVDKSAVENDGKTLGSPSISPTFLVERCEDGLLRSGNVSVPFDAIVAANYLATENFLNLKLSDGQTILAHLENNTEYIKRQLSSKTHEYEEIRKDLLAFKENQPENKTHGSVKQVYFPVGEGYHLLSVLMPSGILFELKKRINDMRFSDAAKASREARKQNKEADDYAEIYELTSIGFGGTKPQNISVLNNQNGGVAYLLPASPPILAGRRINPPRNSFFDLKYSRPEMYQGLFTEFHKTLSSAINNQGIRNKISGLAKAIFFELIDRSWQIRYLDSGWSDSDRYKALPKQEKLWLDSQYRNSEEKDEDWLDTIQQGFVRWFIRGYAKVIGDQQVHSLSDYEFIQLQKWLQECGEGLK